MSEEKAASPSPEDSTTMTHLQLPDSIKVLKKEGTRTTFEISPLMPGYGATIANPLRRVLLSSLAGSAITSIKIKGVDHEFTTIPGVLEDVIQIILNIKKIRFRLHSDGPAKLTLQISGVKTVTADDIEITSDVEIINPDQHIATLTDKKAELIMELEVERGIGYNPVELRKKDKLPIGVISIDAIFSPVRSVNFLVENIRVGDRIDFNKVTMEIETDGSIEPEAAMKQGAALLLDHFRIVSEIQVPEIAEEKKSKTKKASKK